MSEFKVLFRQVGAIPVGEILGEWILDHPPIAFNKGDIISATDIKDSPSGDGIFQVKTVQHVVGTFPDSGLQRQSLIIWVTPSESGL